jgi:hypothetical protein
LCAELLGGVRQDRVRKTDRIIQARPLGDLVQGADQSGGHGRVQVGSLGGRELLANLGGQGRPQGFGELIARRLELGGQRGGVTEILQQKSRTGASAGALHLG